MIDGANRQCLQGRILAHCITGRRQAFVARQESELFLSNNGLTQANAQTIQSKNLAKERMSGIEPLKPAANAVVELKVVPPIVCGVRRSVQMHEICAQMCADLSQETAVVRV